MKLIKALILAVTFSLGEQDPPPEALEEVHYVAPPLEPRPEPLPEYEFQSFIDQKTGLWNYNK